MIRIICAEFNNKSNHRQDNGLPITYLVRWLAGLPIRNVLFERSLSLTQFALLLLLFVT